MRREVDQMQARIGQDVGRRQHAGRERTNEGQGLDAGHAAVNHPTRVGTNIGIATIAPVSTPRWLRTDGRTRL